MFKRLSCILYVFPLLMQRKSWNNPWKGINAPKRWNFISHGKYGHVQQYSSKKHPQKGVYPITLSKIWYKYNFQKSWDEQHPSYPDVKLWSTVMSFVLKHAFKFVFCVILQKTFDSVFVSFSKKNKSSWPKTALKINKVDDGYLYLSPWLF